MRTNCIDDEQIIASLSIVDNLTKRRGKGREGEEEEDEEEDEDEDEEEDEKERVEDKWKVRLSGEEQGEWGVGTEKGKGSENKVALTFNSRFLLRSNNSIRMILKN